MHETPITNPFRHRDEEREKFHRHFNQLHNNLRDAHRNMHAARLLLVDREEYSDTRPCAAQIRARVESMRDAIEAIQNSLSKFDSDMIHSQGCDGTCRMTQAEIAEREARMYGADEE